MENIFLEPSKKEDETKECPFCAETIKAKAIFCRFCNKDLIKKEIKVESTPKKEEYKQPEKIFITPKPKEIIIPENFILVEGDSFTMQEKQIKLSSFYMSKYETTQPEYQNLMLENPSYFKGSNLPVEQVSWFDSIKYCNAKSKKEGFSLAYDESTGELLDQYGSITSDITKVKGYRLPTEAEWEYSARGGNKSQGYTYSGSNIEDEVAWYDKNSYYKGSNSPDYGTHEVGTKKSNELGLYDMSGNVWEWCTDWYDYSYYYNIDTTNPVNTKSADFRVSCGGSWGFDAGDLRVGNRLMNTPTFTNNNLGFRLAITSG